MKTEKELQDEIFKIINKINNTAPELTKYIEENKVELTHTENPEVNLKHLNDYYETLKTLLFKYEANSASSK